MPNLEDVNLDEFPASIQTAVASASSNKTFVETTPTRLAHRGEITINPGATVIVDLDRPAQNCTVTAADVLPTIAVPTAGVVQVTIENITQSRIIVPLVDVRTLTAPALAVDTARALTVGSGVALEADAGDLLRATVTMDGSAAPAPVGAVPSAQLTFSLLTIPRIA